MSSYQADPSCLFLGSISANNGWGDASMTEMNLQNKNLIFLTLVIWSDSIPVKNMKDLEHQVAKV